MKKIVGITLSVILLLSCVSCGMKEQVEYTFYEGGGINGTDGSDLVDSEFESINEMQFAYTGKFVAADKVAKETTKMFELDGRTVKLNYVGTRYMEYDGEEKDALEKCGNIDQYVGDNGTESISLSVYSETGILKKYFINDFLWSSNPTERTMTDQELIDKAKSVVAQYYGKNALEKYICEEVYYNEDNGESFVDFKRMLHGYTTDGMIRIIIRNDGLVCGVVCNHHYELNAVEDNVTKTMIRNAEAALREKIPEKLTIQENVTCVMINGKTGKLYLRMGARAQPTYDKNGNPSPSSNPFFYVNIE